ASGAQWDRFRPRPFGTDRLGQRSRILRFQTGVAPIVARRRTRAGVAGTVGAAGCSARLGIGDLLELLFGQLDLALCRRALALDLGQLFLAFFQLGIAGLFRQPPLALRFLLALALGQIDLGLTALFFLQLLLV